MKKLLIALPLLALCACTSTSLVDPSGVKFTRRAFGTNLQLQRLTVTVHPDGSKTVEIVGYQADQVQAAAAVTEAAVKAAIQGAK